MRLARPAAAMDLSTLAPEVEEKIDVEEMKEYIKGGSQRWLDNPYESMYVVQGCHIVLAVLAVLAAASCDSILYVSSSSLP